jgi:nickel transport protein
MHFAVLLCLLLSPWPVLAHKVTVFAWVEGEMVHTESKFSGGKKVHAGKIEIFDHRDQKILEGTTDGQGQFSFPRPESASALKIVLTAGMGHTNFWLIPPEELGGSRVSDNPQTDAPPPPTPGGSPPIGSPLDADTIEAIVERTVQRELAPLKAQLAREAWGLRDIVAGVGYIIGLMGLASYIQYRKAATGKH